MCRSLAQVYPRWVGFPEGSSELGLEAFSRFYSSAHCGLLEGFGNLNYKHIIIG